MKNIFYFLIFIFNINILSAQNKVDSTNYVKLYHKNGKISSEGILINNKPEGYWKSYFESGKIKSEGNRKNFQLDSTWKFYNEAGTLLMEINYKEGKKFGKRITYAEKESKEEFFEEDNRVGQVKILYLNKQLKQTIPLVNGTEHGTSFVYDESGKLIMLVEYRFGFVASKEILNKVDAKGLKQGVWKEFWDNEKLKYEAFYINDKLDGYYKVYNKDGSLKLIEKYKMGVKIKDAEELQKFVIKNEYYPDGKIKATQSFNLHDKPEGVRREFDKEGNTIAGKIYKNGVLVEVGIVDDKGYKQGKFTEYYADGKIKAIGTYKNNFKIGNWKFYYPNSVLEQEGNYNAQGKADGDWKWYHKSSEVLREQTFINGLEDGPVIEYSDSGIVITKGEYAEGNEEGNWIFYVGNQKYEGSYKSGLKNGVWKIFYSNGILAFEGSFFDDLPEGKHLYYYENGKKKEEGFYKAYKKDGDWKIYNEDGELFITITYQNGIEIKYDGNTNKYLPKEDSE